MHEMAPTQNLHHLPIGGFSLPQLCGQLVLPNSIPYNLEPFNGYYVHGPNYMHQVHQPQNIHHPIGGFLVPQPCEQPVLSNSNLHNLEGFARDYKASIWISFTTEKDRRGSISRNGHDIAPTSASCA
ncbi:hypothetical protein VNO78_25823 [Psophocarpus tetragonolobus]|uniref:Uncharacterized protein n=1 Tax=Psophocarpus tetragonolobus TaxID=3891 RepID=A0AAN9S831_PSOTE